MKSSFWALAIPLSLSFVFAAPADAAIEPTGQNIPSQIAASTQDEMATFYAHSSGPLWITPDGKMNAAAQELVLLFETAADDGLDPAAFNSEPLKSAMQQAKIDPTTGSLGRAEFELSRAFVAYTAALRQSGSTEMTFEHKMLEPQARGTYWTLKDAASASSLVEYIHGMGWMHPLYAPLRWALLEDSDATVGDRVLVRRNLARIRNIPAQPNGRHLVVDAANALLWMYEGNTAVDSMRVVVGKPETGTPSLAGYVRYAIVNPYWNVPDSLVKKTIAPNVLSQGVKYLKVRGYEVLQGWDEDALPIEPEGVDWAAAQRGEFGFRVRQRPSGANSMGIVKYEFPNPEGIYLHDTPEKQLLKKDDRHLSNGCIRLEDAERLGVWLMGGPITKTSDRPEQKIELPSPVPVYITYLTAHADDSGRVAIGPDPYERDATKLAALDTLSAQ